MNQLNLAATFAATVVLTVFTLTCWQLEGRPFESPMEAELAAYKTRHAEDFGGMFGVRGPHSLYAAAERKWNARRPGPGPDDFVPVRASLH